MLYNKINLSVTYHNCPIDDRSYAFSLHSYIITEDHKNYVYVELDSFLKYAGVVDIDSAIAELKKINRLKLQKNKIHFTTKNFIYYKHLNSAIALIHYNLRKSGSDNDILKESLGFLYYGILTSWNREKKRIIDLLDF